jgi:hypothetical protein
MCFSHRAFINVLHFQDAPYNLPTPTGRSSGSNNSSGNNSSGGSYRQQQQQPRLDISPKEKQQGFYHEMPKSRYIFEIIVWITFL